LREFFMVGGRRNCRTRTGNSILLNRLILRNIGWDTGDRHGGTGFLLSFRRLFYILAYNYSKIVAKIVPKADFPINPFNLISQLPDSHLKCQ